MQRKMQWLKEVITEEQWKIAWGKSIKFFPRYNLRQNWYKI